MKTIVVAVGGNSLIVDNEHISVKDQYQAAQETATHIADLIENGWNVVVTHGNGPQVGFILRRSEIAYATTGMHEIPLDVCVADSQGALGYAIQQNISNELKKRNIQKPVVTLVTQVEVLENDEAFKDPTKYIGSFMTKNEADEKTKKFNWQVKKDANRGYRRVVASPKPQKIIELETIKTIIESGAVLITIGGGGIPVVQKNNEYYGVEAVIDKDLASALLAEKINADIFLLSTAVPKVALNFGTANQEWVSKLSLADVKQYLEENLHFHKGSMEPKMRAIVNFLENGGSRAIVTNPENLLKAVNNESGTEVLK